RGGRRGPGGQERPQRDAETVGGEVSFFEPPSLHIIRSPRRRGRAAFGGTPRPSALAVVRSMTRSNFAEARRMLCAIPADLPPAWFPAPSALHRFEPCMP